MPGRPAGRISSSAAGPGILEPLDRRPHRERFPVTQSQAATPAMDKHPQLLSSVDALSDAAALTAVVGRADRVRVAPLTGSDSPTPPSRAWR